MTTVYPDGGKAVLKSLKISNLFYISNWMESKSVAIIHNTIFCEICQFQLQSKENTSLFRLVMTIDN